MKELKSLDDHADIFHKLYEDVNGYQLSYQERQKLTDSAEYTYGEVNFLSFVDLLSLTKPDSNTVFYDLGSGSGKAVITCAMAYPVKKAVGVELFTPLYAAACEKTKQLATLPGYSEIAQKISFMQGNFLEEHSFDDATLIFINSTTMGGIWDALCERVNKLPHLDKVITLTRQLISDKFVPEITTTVQMSWGEVTAFVHSRK